MPTDDYDDPAADTAMFRAYVDSQPEPAARATNRIVMVALVALIVVLAVIAIALLAA
jgi:hypothetical protein